MTNLIYQPRGRAREYARLACNVYRGCSHACVYCYGPASTRRSREEFIQAEPRPDFLTRLSREARKRHDQRQGGQVHLCFTCDPYQPLEDQHGHTSKAIEILHRYGHTVSILTKAGSRALKDLELLGPGDSFGVSLTLEPSALGQQLAEYMEPHSARAHDRMANLQVVKAYSDKITTWASFEPVLFPQQTIRMIHRVANFVDLIKVGKYNPHRGEDPAFAAALVHLHEETNWAAFAQEVAELLQDLNVKYWIKDSLAGFLPEGLPRSCGYNPFD